MSIHSIESMNRRCRLTYGCGCDEVVRLNGGLAASHPAAASTRYRQAHRNARVRGVGWQISFPEWMRIWLDSGHWQQRGTHRGQYCMARHGDVGPYRVDNVSIQLSLENTQFALARAPAASKRNRRGSGRGWTLCRGRYVVQFCGKTIGAFATQEEAERTYAAAAAVV